MSRGLCHWCVPGDPYRTERAGRTDLQPLWPQASHRPAHEVDRSTVSNKIHSRLFELGIRDPELFRLLRKLDNIEKVEKEMTEDRPSFF